MTCIVSDLFEIRYGHSLELNALTISNSKEGIPFVSRRAGNNGISAYVEPIEGIEAAPAGNITCALSANALTTYLQETDFYCGYHIAILKPKIKLNKQKILFYCMCIKANQFRYNYGRQANKTLHTLLIPSTNEIPAWVDKTNLNKFTGKNKSLFSKPTPALNIHKWHSFTYDQLFTIVKGKRLTKEQMSVGKTPFIGSIDSNNGCRQYINAKPNHKENTITINYNGSVAEAFYQAHPFWASDDVNVLYPKFELTPHIGLFLCSLIKQEKFRFNYGRKWHLGRMKESRIQLPVLSNGTPDWQFMGDYIKSLPYSNGV